jgi:hypothetical protein
MRKYLLAALVVSCLLPVAAFGNSSLIYCTFAHNSAINRCMTQNKCLHGYGTPHDTGPQAVACREQD